MFGKDFMLLYAFMISIYLHHNNLFILLKNTVNLL